MSEKITTLNGLVEFHAKEQARDAGATYTQANILGYLGSIMEHDTKVAYVRQLKIADKLKLRWPETVTRGIQALSRLSLLTDLDKGLRNRAHHYELTLDWSFSTVLIPAPAPTQLTVVTSQPAPAPEPESFYANRGHKLGWKGPNKRDGFCNSCQEDVPRAAGFIVKFCNGETRCFCKWHAEAAQKLAKADWHPNQGFPPGETIRDVAEREQMAFIRRSIDTAQSRF